MGSPESISSHSRNGLRRWRSAFGKAAKSRFSWDRGLSLITPRSKTTQTSNLRCCPLSDRQTPSCATWMGHSQVILVSMLSRTHLGVPNVSEEARMGTVPLDVDVRYCTRKPATYSKPAASLNAKVPIIPDCVRVSTLAEMSPLPLLVAVPRSLQLLDRVQNCTL